MKDNQFKQMRFVMKLNNEKFKRLPAISSIILFLLIFITAGCSKSSSSYNNNPVTPPTGSNQVNMQNTSYSPQSLTISKGTTVTWTNKDPYNHTVTSGTPGHPSGLFDSGNIAANGTYSYTFNSTGTFSYYCKIHLASMTGTIVVQ